MLAQATQSPTQYPDTARVRHFTKPNPTVRRRSDIALHDMFQQPGTIASPHTGTLMSAPASATHAARQHHGTKVRVHESSHESNGG